MDAFVESLFAPEMRGATSLLPSPPPSRGLPLLSPPSLESLQAMGLATPPTSALCGRVAKLAENGPRATSGTPTNGAASVPPPPNSLLGGGILSNALAQYQVQQQPFQPGTEDQPLFVRLADDDVFTQLLADQDFDFQSDKKEAEKPPNSLLLEPLDLPPKSSEHCFKDTFIESYRVGSSGGGSTISRGGILSSSPPSSGGFTLDSMMPVFPLSANNGHMYYGYTGCPPPLSPTSNPWMQENQEVSTPGNCSFQRVHMTPMNMKHMMAMASASMSSPIVQQSNGDMFVANSSPTTSAPLWISASSQQPKASVARPPFSLTISPPASLTNRDVKALKELIVSTDYGSPQTPGAPLVSRPKRQRSIKTEYGSRAKAARTTSASSVSQENSSDQANIKITKGKKCIEPNCTRRAQSNSRCKAHGGGARCQFSGPGGCTRSSQGGGFCRAHGGGKRCEYPGCQRGQQRKGRCYVHGGIRKCQYGGCEKKDRGNGFCISHGGGKRCDHPNCSRAVRRGLYCQVHEAQNTAEKTRSETVSL
ncbi:hypothetical protein PHYBOEH_002028 [Phytophthora boehmeriae]|uniref:WRKY19-like zinc finger domain-containing protein n=1 Tax=Phytophthora boehmeriae TaxID=109152 RepID=A0A8T1WWK0_9STRA|nr:hypothetical protein PHYBOEH_002028 [Phytophthora boehmeriae]